MSDQNSNGILEYVLIMVLVAIIVVAALMVFAPVITNTIAPIYNEIVTSAKEGNLGSILTIVGFVTVPLFIAYLALFLPKK